MNVHHAVRIRLLVQRVSFPGVISPSNCGMAMHAMRQLDALNTRNRELLRRVAEVYPTADIRSRANMFHCLACCTREQQSVHESLSEPLEALLVKMQESLLSDVDDLSPTESILVMEGILRVSPYRCVAAPLSALLYSRATALVDVMSSPLELIGIARIIVDAVQEPQPSTTSGSDDSNTHNDYRLRLGCSKELCKVAQTIESRLDTFSKQDLLTLVDAITLRTSSIMKKSTKGDNEEQMERQRSSELTFRDVPDECRPLLLRVFGSARQLVTSLSPSQVSAWLLRVVFFRAQHHPLFMSLLHRLDAANVDATLSRSQLSKCIECLGASLPWAHEDGNMSKTDLQYVTQLIVKLLQALVSKLEKSGTPHNECSLYLVPLFLSLSDAVVAGRLNIAYPLMQHMFHIPYKHFGVLTPRERADVVTAVFLWGFFKQSPRLSQQQQQVRHCPMDNSNNKSKNDSSSLESWCSIILAHAESYNVLDILQIINEISAAIYAEAAGGDIYDLYIVRPVLTQLQGQLQRMHASFDRVPSSHLARYMTSMSKLGVRRKSDYYEVLNTLQKRELTAFENLRVLGVVARHHLRAVTFLTQVVNEIPQRTSLLHAKQKCLLVKYLGQARAQRLVRSSAHRYLQLGLFLTPEEVVGLPLLHAVFAFVGLVELRQFENKTLECLLCGPLSHQAGFVNILSAATLCELVTALCRVDASLVSALTLQTVLEVSANRLALSRSFFVDLAEISFWLPLVRDWPLLNSNRMIQKETNNEAINYTGAVVKFQSVAAAIATTRLLDIAGMKDLQVNTFLYGQMAMGYRLKVSLPGRTLERLSRHLDIKHLSQILSDPKQVVGAVVTALYISSVNPRTATDILEFAIRNFGSLGAQEALVLGVEVSKFLHDDAENTENHTLGLLKELQMLAMRDLRDVRRLKRLSTQEVALGSRYGIVGSGEKPLTA